MSTIIDEITKDQLKEDRGNFKVGDGVKVHLKISQLKKSDKKKKVEFEERMQVIEGIVIARKGGGIHETFTVRRIKFDEGVECVFPLHSPRVLKVEVNRESVVMKRAKLHYLRDRIGKDANKVKEKRIIEAARNRRSGSK